jgi:hypothetical protein
MGCRQPDGEMGRTAKAAGRDGARQTSGRDGNDEESSPRWVRVGDTQGQGDRENRSEPEG